MDPSIENISGQGIPVPSRPQGVVLSQSQAGVQATEAQSGAVITSDIADDNFDGIDQKWVSKAKDVVERTKHDPYLESNELSKLKSGYLKVRYNKQIKTAEDGAR